MHKQTKACSIPPKVKAVVWERDEHKCIICDSHAAAPCAHYIARSQGGLGIEQNIVTLCADCHRAYDQSTSRGWYRERIRAYLQAHYPNWNESKLVYHKYD
jgi:5-methylcytosine-specific restriction endonuclease McrA